MSRALYLTLRYLLCLASAVVVSYLAMLTPLLRYVFELLFTIFLGVPAAAPYMLTIFLLFLFSLIATLLDNSQVGPATASALVILLAFFNSPVLYVLLNVLQTYKIASLNITNFILRLAGSLQFPESAYSIFVIISLVSIMMLILARFLDSSYMFLDITSLVAGGETAGRALTLYLLTFLFLCICAGLVAAGAYLTLSTSMFVQGPVSLVERMIGPLVLMIGLVGLVLGSVTILRRF